MAERFAVRNIRLCTKDCLCLYVCPTGATDTENSIIDVEKCIGCGACADGCPSGAISMVPKAMPPQQPHGPDVVAALNALRAGVNNTLRIKLARVGIVDIAQHVFKQNAQRMRQRLGPFNMRRVAYLEIVVPHMQGLRLNAHWQHTHSSNNFAAHARPL